GEIYSGYREKGYFPDAFINMLALLGWHGSGNQELYSKEELTENFSLERVSKSGAKFDAEKTKWFNQQYLRLRTDEEMAKALVKEIERKGEKEAIQAVTDDYLVEVCRLMKEKVSFVYEIFEQGRYFFSDPATYDEGVIKKRWNAQAGVVMTAVKDAFASMQSWNAADCESTFKTAVESAGANPGQLMQLFRVCVSGAAGGPVLFEMVALLGKDVVVRRIETAIQKLR
ncbi:MAG TPA: glutamate--tRNA ligase family protein, partial [Bacteroidia bacterium]|nr:glutamate--tRNA ligase family protein [Bacteroidia bacterium]